MPSFEEARKTILDHVTALGAEVVPTLDAIGRVLASDRIAPWNFPSWDNSAMDGFAVRAEDVTGPTSLQLVGSIPAGAHRSERLAQGTTVQILTGAPLPPGADAVVPQEEVQSRNGAVFFEKPVRVGAHVRRQGEDMRQGEIIISAGTILGPAEVSVLASCGRLSVPVVCRARVAILSTGDELAEPGEPLAPGQIYNSNALALAAAVKQLGAEPVVLEIARDDREALKRLLLEGLRADALITSAGVSMGERDLVREVLQELSVKQLFWQIDIKPGRPTAFGKRGDTLVFSLPGNPVSALLTFEQFVRPALLKMMGHQKVLRPLVRAVLREGLSKKPGRIAFSRVRLERRDGELLAWSAGNQETGILKTLLQADGIAILPADWSSVQPGATVEVQIIRSGFEMCQA